MRAAIYARVSSVDQRDRNTIESQLRVLPEFVRARGWELGETYVDDGHTAKAGKLGARRGLADMLRDAVAKKFEVVVVLDVDRLTRSEDLAERGQILGALQRAKVKVAVAMSGQVLDFNDSMGDLYGSLQAFFAAEWSRKHRARILEGKLTAIARGKKPAGPTPYGYRYERATGVWSVDELAAAVVREIFDRSAAGDTGDAIAADLEARGVPRPRGGRWSRERVYGVLAQPAYRGEWIADKTKKLSIAVPRIVSDEVWYAARDRAGSLSRRRRGLRRTKHVYLLEGLAVCSLCAAPVGIASSRLPDAAGPFTPARYVCTRRRRPDDRGRCLAPYQLTADVDARVWGALRELVLVPGRLENAARGSLEDATETAQLFREDLAAAERRLAHVARVKGEMLARFRTGALDSDELDVQLAALRRDRELAEHQVDAAKHAQRSAGRQSTRAAELETLVSRMRSRVEATSAAERRALVASLFRPGTIRLSIATIELSLGLRREPARALGLVSATDWISGDETIMTFRLVA